MGIAPDSILGVAVDTVTSKINDLNSLGDKYGARLSAALAQIGNIKMVDVEAPTRIIPPDAQPPASTLGPIPNFRRQSPAMRCVWAPMTKPWARPRSRIA